MQGLDPSKLPRHVAVIMDGNGRWAKARGLPRTAGHKVGVDRVRELVRSASELKIDYLTLFAFSSENWSRPQEEISDLMGLLKLFIRKDLDELARSNVRIRVIGSRDSLQDDICALLREAEDRTAANSGATLIIAFNYGGRDEIVRAMRKLACAVRDKALQPDQIDETRLAELLDTAAIPDPDLVIRTSGEQRLSNFLLWQAAYAELVFVDSLWPDFDRAAFHQALNEYASRERRFGAVAAPGLAVGS
ncbi:isoprenyl transferase [Pseudohoeflea coraliihabitans]|uniref:Isoprenyl transferase n=1 Tax=Pseudohoeflea coraliihabitans TaxID=2860393 RepID=A0ABS6WRA2_9HYPH|nr:isoprenyl transferase [Pseudohoeflea sp. DP4N28-3]MBW3098498.1 isoprenyl transferase [Pseudohoeflea sp. DP4N28-3]